MSETTHEIEIPASALRAVGAANADEFFAKLATSVRELTNTVASHTEALSNPATMTEERITQIAEAAGSRKAAEALGATGVTPPAPPSMPLSTAVRTAPAKRRPEPQQSTQSTYAAQFLASAELQLEFGELPVFIAFMRAKHAGQIKVIE